MIAAAGMTNAPVALVPPGGLAQIPDGGTPFFLGNLTVVDVHDRTLSEVAVEAVEQSTVVVDVAIHNRSKTTTLTVIAIAPVGFAQAQGIWSRPSHRAFRRIRSTHSRCA